MTRCKHVIRRVVDATFLESQRVLPEPEADPEPLLDLWSRRGRWWVQELPLPQDYAQLRREDLTLLNRREVLRWPESTLERIGTAAQRAFPVPEAVAPVWRDPLRRLDEVFTGLEPLVARYEQDLIQLLVQTDALRWLTLPGIGVVCAGDLYGELGSPAWCASAKPAVKWAGLDPAFSQSGEQPVRSGRMSREGNRWLRAAATQAAAVLAPHHHNAYFLQYGARLPERGKAPQQILVAVAHKCLHGALAMIRTHQVFAPPTWEGPPLAQDWRQKIPHKADRLVAEETWGRLVQNAPRR